MPRQERQALTTAVTEQRDEFRGFQGYRYRVGLIGIETDLEALIDVQGYCLCTMARYSEFKLTSRLLDPTDYPRQTGRATRTALQQRALSAAISPQLAVEVLSETDLELRYS